MSAAAVDRRAFVVWMGAAGLAACATIPKENAMYGLIGKMIAAPGKRDELIAILIAGVAGMPGCRSYVVAADASDANALWVTEVWADAASHKASLSLPSVQEAIRIGRPLIAGFGERFETTPIGGFGLAA